MLTTRDESQLSARCFSLKLSNGQIRSVPIPLFSPRTIDVMFEDPLSSGWEYTLAIVDCRNLGK